MVVNVGYAKATGTNVASDTMFRRNLLRADVRRSPPPGVGSGYTVGHREQLFASKHYLQRRT
jgi:hypothetical protein